MNFYLSIVGMYEDDHVFQMYSQSWNKTFFSFRSLLFNYHSILLVLLLLKKDLDMYPVAITQLKQWPINRQNCKIILLKLTCIVTQIEYPLWLF